MKPVFQFVTISVGGCGGQHMGAKSILMVVSQISASRHHLHTLFFTHLPIFDRNTANWSRAYQYWTPCTTYIFKWTIKVWSLEGACCSHQKYFKVKVIVISQGICLIKTG